jgi:zinc protease
MMGRTARKMVLKRVIKPVFSVAFVSSLLMLSGTYMTTVMASEGFVGNSKGFIDKAEGSVSNADGSDNSVFEKTLANGLKVIVKPDHRAPVVVSQVWYKVGSSYESGGTTGVSHVLEHMMFKGTEKIPSGEFNKIISRNGGEDNAFTSRDYTAYYQKLEKSRLKVSFELESDRMRGLLLPQKEFEKEIMVVMEERRWRTDDKPQSLTAEQFQATAYDNSGYHNPIIGWMDDLKNMQVDDLKTWYQRYYAPNNATIVVVGDVEPEAVFDLAEHYFGPLKPFNIAAAKPRVERQQKGGKRIKMELEAKLPYLIMGYKVPVLNTAEQQWEPFALDLLAGILDGGESSRFSKNLVRGSKIATSAGAGYSMDSRMGTLFLLNGIPAEGVTSAQLEQALLKELDDIKNNLVSTQELQRIKAQVISSAVYEQDSMFYQAMKIGVAETVGIGWREDRKYVEKLQAITAEQVQQVAKKYFIPSTLTVANLLPIQKQIQQGQAN